MDEETLLARGREMQTDREASVVILVVARAKGTGDAGTTHIGVVSPAGERVVHLHYAPISEHRRRWVANVALDMVRRLALNIQP